MRRAVGGQRHLRRAAKGYIASAPELRQPIVALSLASLRNRMLSGNGSAPWASLSQITAKNGGDEQTFGAK